QARDGVVAALALDEAPAVGDSGFGHHAVARRGDHAVALGDGAHSVAQRAREEVVEALERVERPFQKRKIGADVACKPAVQRAPQRPGNTATRRPPDATRQRALGGPAQKVYCDPLAHSGPVRHSADYTKLP